MSQPRLAVVICSTRPGRSGLPIGEWFADAAREHGGFEVDLVDLAEVDLPFLDEPKHPRLREYTHQHTWDWSKRVLSADALVLVTAEYNYGYPAPIKNAIDCLSREWAYLPVGFVSYGGIAAGTRAVQQFKQVVTTLRMTPVFENVNIAFHARHIEDGVFTAPDGTAEAAKAMLDEMVRNEQSLRGLRAEARAGMED